MLRPGRHLLIDIGQDDVERDHAELAVIHRYDRAMSAAMFASARRVGRAGNTAASVGHLQRRITISDGSVDRSG